MGLSLDRRPRKNVLLSQRRRWLLSAVHNIYLLLGPRRVPLQVWISLFFSLIGWWVSPALVAALLLQVIHAVMIHTFLWFGIMWASLIVLTAFPVVVLSVKHRFHTMMLLIPVYIVGLVITCFITPIYAVWNCEQLGWGKTRKAGVIPQGAPSSKPNLIEPIQTDLV